MDKNDIYKMDVFFHCRWKTISAFRKHLFHFPSDVLIKNVIHGEQNAYYIDGKMFAAKESIFLR